MTDLQITTLVIMIVISLAVLFAELYLYDVYIRKERKSGWSADWVSFWVSSAHNGLCEAGAITGFILSLLC